MKPYDTKTIEIDGYTVTLSFHYDTDNGAPWENEDGHGPVTKWECRDKAPHEMILSSDGRSRRFYDFQEAVSIAKRDGWGLSADNVVKLETRLKRKATKGDICHAAAMADFEHLRAWCNNEWYYVGYTTEIATPEGETIDGDSCWGFASNDDYMDQEAESNARFEIERLKATAAETQLALCYP